MTELWLLLINLVFWPPIVYALYIDKLPASIFSVSVAMILFFNFVWLLYGKQQNDHLDQIDKRLDQIDTKAASLLKLEQKLKPVIEMQARLSVQTLSQMSGRETFNNLKQKWRLAKNLERQLESFGFDEELAEGVISPVETSIKQVLVESFSNAMVQEIGRRNFMEFMAKRPREEWTDQLFIDEAKQYLIDQNLQSEVLKKQLDSIATFEKYGELVQ